MYEDKLLTKDELAKRLRLKPRGIDCLVSDGRIPAIKISKRCVRFSWTNVREALDKLEKKAVA